jgi:hypothetical protein
MKSALHLLEHYRNLDHRPHRRPQMISSSASEFAVSLRFGREVDQQLADAVFEAALCRDEAMEAGRMQEASRWQAVLRAIDELVPTRPGRILH